MRTLNQFLLRKKNGRFLLGYSLLLLVCFSCNTDEISNLNQDVDPSTIEVRASGDSLTTAEINWLDDFRLNLKDTTINDKYSVDDAIYGMEAFFNLISGHGSKKINESHVRSETGNYTISDDSLSRSVLRDFFDDIYADVDDFYADLTVSNKSFLFLDLTVSRNYGTSIDVAYDI